MESNNLSKIESGKMRSSNISWSKIIGFFILFMGVGIFKMVNHGNVVHKAIQEVKSKITLPYQIDSITSLVSIEEGEGSVRFGYSINSSGDWTTGQKEGIRQSQLQYVCNDPTMRDQILNNGTKIEYSYKSTNDSQSFIFTISQADCLSK